MSNTPVGVRLAKLAKLFDNEIRLGKGGHTLSVEKIIQFAKA
jgi:hypothetical protein